MWRVKNEKCFALFLITATLTFQSFKCVVSIQSQTGPTIPSEEDLLRELRGYLEQKIRQLKLDFHKQFETDRIRSKREAGWLISLQDENAVQQRDIRVTEQLTQTPAEEGKTNDVKTIGEYPISCWTSVALDSGHLLFLITSKRDLVLLNFNGSSFGVILKLEVDDEAYSAKAYYHGNEIWFAVTHGGSQGSFKHYIQLYVYDGNDIAKKQSIPLQTYSDIDIIRSRRYWYLVVGTVPDFSTDHLDGQIMLYQWRATQFDLVAQQFSKGIRSVTSWLYEGVLYLGVARSVPDDSFYGSVVYAYHESADKLTTIQVIQTYFAYRVIHFEVDGIHYVVFLGVNGAHLYWWAGNEFIFFQKLEGSEGAINIDSLPLPNGEMALALAFKDSVSLYTEDSLSQYVKAYRLKVGSYQAGVSTMAATLASARFFSRVGSYYYLFLTYQLNLEPDFKQPANAYKLNLTSHRRVIEEPLDPLTACIVTLNNSLSEKQEEMEKIGSKVEHVWVTNKEQSVTAPVVVRGNVIVVNELDAGTIVLTSPDTILPHLTNSQLHLDILQQKSALDAMRGDADNLMYKSKHQTIYGPLRFLTPPLIRNGHLGGLMNPEFLLNGIPVCRIIDATLKLTGQPQVFVDDLTVQGLLRTRQLSTDGSLNGIQPQNLFLLNTDDVLVTGDLVFSELSTKDVNLLPGGRVNGLEPRHFALNDEQLPFLAIEGVKTFVRLRVVKDTRVRGNTNGRKFADIPNTIVTIRGNPDVWSQFDLETSLVIDGDLNVRDPINGYIDVRKLAAEALTLDETDQDVTGKKIFKGPVFVDGDVTVDGLTNGIDVSEELFSIDTPQTVPGHFIFDKPIQFMSDLFTGLVNGVDLSEETVNQYNGSQTVSGLKRFLSNLAVTGDLTATDGATINGVDVSELSRSIVTPDNFAIWGKTVFDSMVVQYVDKFTVVNDIDYRDFETDLWRKSLDQIVPATVQLNNPVECRNDLEVNDVNGINLERDLIRTFGDDDIPGSFNFVEDLYAEKPLILAEGITINGYDISEYNQSLLSLDKPCEVRGSKYFPSLEVLGNVVVRGKLNGLKPSSEFLLKHVPQDVNGHYSFHYPLTKITGNLFVDTLDVGYDISGLDFSEFAEQVVLLDDPRHIPIENKRFVGGLKANNINVFGLIDGVDVRAFREHAVPLKSRGFVAIGHNFTDLDFQGDVYASMINGFPFEEFINRLVYTGEPTIRGPKTITGSLKVNGDLAYTGFLNGVNLVDFLSNIAYLRANNTFSAPVHFLGGLVADKVEVSSHSLVDGVPWSELVYLNRDEILTGYNRFIQDITAEKDVYVQGLINGCDLNLLAQNALYSNSELQIITGSMSVGNLIVNGNLKVANGIGINGIDLEDLARNLVTKHGNGQIVATPLHFRKGLIVDSLILNSGLNGVDLIFLLNDAVSKTVPQTIAGNKQFLDPEGLVFPGGLTINGDLDSIDLINGVDVRAEAENALLRVAETQNIFGLKTFRNVIIHGDLYVLGTINGLAIPNDLVLKSTDEVVPVPTHLGGPITSVQGDLVFHRSVDGIDLDDFIHSRATLSHDEVFSADITFLDKVNIDWLDVMGSINNIPMSSVVVKSRNFRIGGRKIVVGNVYVDADFEAETINDIDIPQLERSVVRHDQHQIITGPTIFIEPIEVRRNIIVESKINGQPIDTISERYLSYWHSLSDVTGKLTSMTEAQEAQIRRQFHMQKNGFVTFAHFELIQTLQYSLDKMFTYPAYDSQSMNPSLLLYGWTTKDCDEDGECCAYNTAVFSLDENGFPNIASDEQPGRLIPLTFKLPYGAFSGNFHFWTNTTTTAYDCVSNLFNLEESAIISSSANGFQNRFHMVVPHSPFVRDVLSFDSDAAHYVIVAYAFDKNNRNTGVLQVYRYEPAADEWSHHQSLSSTGIFDMDLMTLDSEIFLATAATKPGVSSIFKWIGGQFVMMTQLPSSWPKCVLWARIDSQLYLILGNERYVDDDIPIYTEPIVIYRYNWDTNNLEWYQHVSVQGAVDITTFKLGGETYLVSASRNDQMVSVIQWKGYSGFKLVDEFPVPLVNDLQLYWSFNGDLYLIISTDDCRTLVMKATTIGRGLSPLSGLPYHPDYDLLIRGTSTPITP